MPEKRVHNLSVLRKLFAKEQQKRFVAIEEPPMPAGVGEENLTVDSIDYANVLAALRSYAQQQSRFTADY